MSPEQVKGTPANQRADIWAFGVIVHELLTGKVMFQGETAVEILGQVLNSNPDITQAPARVHPLLRWCLEKERKDRLAAIGDARRLLAEEPAAVTASAAPAPAWKRPAAWAIAGLVVGALGALWRGPGPAPQPSGRLSIALPAGQELTSYPAITPDRRNVAYAASQGSEEALLYLRH